MRGSTALQQMLGEVLRGVEPPARGRDYNVSLRRNREIQRRLQVVASLVPDPEATWPGISELRREMKRREGEFLRRSRPEA